MPASLPRKLTIFVLSSFVLLVLAELLARMGEPGPMSLFDVSPYERVGSLPHVHRRGAHVAWDGTYYEINGRGWRGPRCEPTYAPDELRIVAIGDSCTFGKGVEESECWPRQLERLLRERLGPTRSVLVANLGVNGYSGANYLEVLTSQALPLRPDIVIVGYNINDFPNVVKQVDAQVFQGRGNLRARLPYELRGQLGKLAIFRRVRALYYDVNRERDLRRVEEFTGTVAEERRTSPEAMQLEGRRMSSMLEQCSTVGAELALFLVPYESQVYLEDAKREPVDATRALAHSNGIEFVETLEPFRQRVATATIPPRLFLRGDRYHPNARGYAIIAVELAAALERRGWLSNDD